MTDNYPYKFNVTSLEYEDVAAYLRPIPKSRWRIDTREMHGELTIDEWRTVKAIEAHDDAITSGDDHHVTDENERAALIQTDTADKIDITVKGIPAYASRRLLNRIAVQGGVNNAGVSRDSWRAQFTRGVEGYLVQFRDRTDGIMFKLAMWKRPEEGLLP